MASCARSYPPYRRAQEPPRYPRPEVSGACDKGIALISSSAMFFAPFLFLYWIIFFLVIALLFGLLEIGVINYAFNALGLPPHTAFLALMASLLGSYINIPITRIEGGEPAAPEVVSHFGMRYPVPTHLAAGRSTVVAINVGGAIVPLCICAWILAANAAV